MKRCIPLSAIACSFILFGCNSRTEVKTESVKISAVNTDSIPEPPPPPAPTGLKVSAYLIYTDSTLSSFDVLNDKTKALWNTIIGEGDAGKPSEKTKVLLTGKLDSLHVTILNGKIKVVNQTLPAFSGDYEFIIPDTGCDEVKVLVTKAGKTVYKGRIEYHCGE